MFGGCTRQSQSSASAPTTSSIDSNVNLVTETEGKLSKDSRWHQNRINQQEAQIKGLQAQSQQPGGPPCPKIIGQCNQSGSDHQPEIRVAAND